MSVYLRMFSCLAVSSDGSNEHGDPDTGQELVMEMLKGVGSEAEVSPKELGASLNPFSGTFPVIQLLISCRSSHQSPKNGSVVKQGNVYDVALAGM